MEREKSMILVAPGRGVSPYEFNEPQVNFVNEEEELDEVHILPVDERIEEEDNLKGEAAEEEATITLSPKNKKTSSNKTKWALAFLLLCGIAVGAAIGFSSVANKRKNDTSRTSSSVLEAASLEDCLLAEKIMEDELATSTTVPSDEIAAVGSKSGKSIKTDAGGEPFVRRRDLRGSGKAAVEVDWLVSRQRKMECEELMKSSKSSKSIMKKSTKSSKQTGSSSSKKTTTTSPSKTSTPTPTKDPAQTPSTPDRPPTNKPTEQQPAPVTVNPAQMVTLKPVTNSPSKAPTPKPVTISPTTKTTIPADYYKYKAGTTQCSGSRVDNTVNIDGPAPFADKSNVALQFFAYGDSPYDSHTNTCIGEDGSKESDCGRFDCTNSEELSAGNTCTFEGPEYNCLKDVTIPWMNSKIDAGDAAFMAHTGDIIRGSSLGENKRCTNYTFSSRQDLFSTGTNSLVVPGDNEWNECYGYRVSSNTDPIREMWRDNFARQSSPLYQFSKDFPGGGRPTIYRQSTNPENYFFNHSGVAFFGINRPDRYSYISNRAPVDVNEQWVAERLAFDTPACTFKSIVVLAHSWAKESLFREIDEYFNSCGETLPILSVSGNNIPTSYCMSKNVTNSRVNVTVEAFQSAPMLISVVRDPAGGDYFHVEDFDLNDSNIQCPTFLLD